MSLEIKFYVLDSWDFFLKKQDFLMKRLFPQDFFSAKYYDFVPETFFQERFGGYQFASVKFTFMQPEIDRFTNEGCIIFFILF